MFWRRTDVAPKIDFNLKVWSNFSNIYVQIYCSTHFYVNVSKQKLFYI